MRPDPRYAEAIALYSAALEHEAADPADPADGKVKFTGLSKNLGQLQDSSRDFQPNCWANVRSLGQPCEFHFFQVGGAAEQLPEAHVLLANRSAVRLRLLRGETTLLYSPSYNPSYNSPFK